MKSSIASAESRPAYEQEMPRSPAPSGSTIAALWTLYVLTIRQHQRGKRWMIMGFLFLLPPALAILIRALNPALPSRPIEFILVFMFIPQALLPLLALLYASGMIQDELEDQTLTYLLIRPMPKWALFLAKLLATLTTTVVLAMFFTSLTYAAIYLGAPNVGNEDIGYRIVQGAWIMGLSAAAYCCLFACISLFTRRSLVAGILYIFVFEGLIANIDFAIRRGTIMYYLRILTLRRLDFTDQVVMNPRNKHTLVSHLWHFDLDIDPKLVDHPQVATCIQVLLGACFLATLIAAFIFSTREFRVKTPEGS